MQVSLPNDYRRWDEVSRRSFITRMAQTMLGVSFAPLLPAAAAAAEAARAASAKSVIYLFMNGGMSQLDTFDPKPGREVQGPVEAISTRIPGVQLSEYLPELAKQIDRVAILRSLTTETGAHGPGRYLMRTSYAEIASTRHPSLGAWSQLLLGKANQQLPGNVVIGAADGHPGAGFLDARHSPVPVPNPRAGLENVKPPKYLSEKQFDRRMNLATAFDRGFQKQYPDREVQSYNELYGEAIRLLKSQDLKAFDINEESEQTRAAYGDNNFGLGCLLARRLVQNRVRYVEVISDGWDHHRDVFEALPKNAAELDQALSALLNDLHARRLLDETLVVVATEFGRSPKVNQNAGRDHHPGAFSCLLAGGGIRGGQVLGASDEDARQVMEDHVTVADFNATIGYALGLPLDKELYSPTRRPFKVAHDGAPLTSLFG